MFAEQEITTHKLVEIFQSAYMDVSDIEENRFSVKGIQFPFPLVVQLDIDRKRIHFRDFNRLHRISSENAARLCNEVNNQYSLARFYAFEYKGAVMAVCEYEMTYEKGVIPYQVISNFRTFEEIAGKAVREAFKDYLRE